MYTVYVSLQFTWNNTIFGFLGRFSNPLQKNIGMVCILPLEKKIQIRKKSCYPQSHIPIGSMYGIFTYIWHKSMVNVGKYSIHGSYGIRNPSAKMENTSSARKTCFITKFLNHQHDGSMTDPWDEKVYIYLWLLMFFFMWINIYVHSRNLT